MTYPTLTDALADSGETTALTVGGVAATGTINDPAAPTVNSVTNATVTEGTNLVHTVTLTGATSNPTTYAFTLAGNTATAGTDFTNAPTFSNGVTLAAGVLTVPAGVTTFTVTYPTLTDAARRHRRDHGGVGGWRGRGRHDQRPGGTDGELGDQCDGHRRGQPGPHGDAVRRDDQPDAPMPSRWPTARPRRAPTTPTRRPSATASRWRRAC